MIKLFFAIAFMILLTGCVESVTGHQPGETLKVGVKEDVPGFGFFNTKTNTYEGFEIDLAKMIAKELGYDEEKIEFIPVSTRTRGPLLDNFEVDFVIATFTITEERKQLYSFTTPYYTDYIGFMVKKLSGIKSLSELNGKTIGVVKKAPTMRELQMHMDEINLNFTFEEYISALDVRKALDKGEVDAFSIGHSILHGYFDDTTIILPDMLIPQPLGVATHLENADLCHIIDGLIKQWLKDGTIDRLTDKHRI